MARQVNKKTSKYHDHSYRGGSRTNSSHVEQLKIPFSLEDEVYEQETLPLFDSQELYVHPHILELQERVRNEFLCSAHDIDHTWRVYKICLYLAENEAVDLEVLQAAALLHDIARVKEDEDSSGKVDHASLGAQMAEPVLTEIGFPREKISLVQHCITTHRYRTGNRPHTKEAEVLFDADKLDGIGAIGIARSLQWLGRNDGKIFEKVDINAYLNENMQTKNNGRIQEKTKHNLYIEFETKIKFIKSKLFTKRAKEVATKRLRYYRTYLSRLEKEINGEL